MSQFRMGAAVLMAMVVLMAGSVVMAQGPPPQSAIDAKGAAYSAYNGTSSFRGVVNEKMNYAVETIVDYELRLQACITAYEQDPDNPDYDGLENYLYDAGFDLAIPDYLYWAEVRLDEAGEDYDLGEPDYTQALENLNTGDSRWFLQDWSGAEWYYNLAKIRFNSAFPYYGDANGHMGDWPGGNPIEGTCFWFLNNARSQIMTCEDVLGITP